MYSYDINVGADSTYDVLHWSSGVVLNEKGFSHHGRVWVKKLVHRTDSRTDGRMDSGTGHKIGIENNRRYYRRRSIRKGQDRRRIKVST